MKKMLLLGCLLWPLSIMADSEVISFTLPDLEGQQVSVDSFRGQWVVVNYWATWCAPCRKEIPDLSALHQAREDVVVLGLAFEDVSVDEFKAFLAENPAEYPILLVDVYAPPETLGSPKVLPTTYVLNPAGELTKTFFGPVTREAIEHVIDHPSTE